MPAFSLTPIASFPQETGTEFPNPLAFAQDGVPFVGPITMVDFTGGSVTEDGDGTLTVPLGGGGGGGYNPGCLLFTGRMRFGGTDGYDTYHGYGTDSNNTSLAEFAVSADAVNVDYTNSGSGPMVLDQGTWLVTVFAEVYNQVGGDAAGAQPTDAPKLNIEVQSPYATMDNIFPIPVGALTAKFTVSTTVVTGGASVGERTLILRSYAQWDVIGNASSQYDCNVDLQVFVTKLAEEPTWV